MADEIPTLDPVTRGDYERIEFSATAPGGGPFVPASVAFGAAEKRFSGPVVVLKNTTDDPEGFELDTGETDDEGNPIYRVILQENDLAAVTRETVLACDVVLHDAEGRDSTTRFYLPVHLRVTPLDAGA